jgi:hypothetical protein
MTTENETELQEVLDSMFPKGKCKERGQALVLFAVAIRQLRLLNNKRAYWEKKYKEEINKE